MKCGPLAGRTAKPSRDMPERRTVLTPNEECEKQKKKKTTDTNLLNLWGEVEKLLESAADTAYLDTRRGKIQSDEQVKCLQVYVATEHYHALIIDVERALDVMFHTCMCEKCSMTRT